MTSHRKLSATRSPKDSSAGESRVASSPTPRHRLIYEELLAEIQAGVYKPGDRLPSEALLCQRFDASRITVAKAVQSLQRDNFVTRRPGSGTYVELPSRPDSLQFGLLIPDLGTTDIFGPICQGIMRSPAAKLHSLAWGHSTGEPSDNVNVMTDLCRQYIADRVAGVFFAPFEFAEGKDASNHKIASMLNQAGIPVVLLDRCFERYPDRSNYDLVGIDNHRVGYVLTRHLMQAGAKRIIFAMRGDSASTVMVRASGYRDAVSSVQNGSCGNIVTGDFEDVAFVKQMLSRCKPDGIVCANDLTAARLMQSLISLGVTIPGDIKMAGVDDVRYANFLPTPLTTIRQNCAEIGAAAMTTMLSRIENPHQPARDVLVRFDLIVRASTGGSQPDVQ